MERDETTASILRAPDPTADLAALRIPRPADRGRSSLSGTARQDRRPRVDRKAPLSQVRLPRAPPRAGVTSQLHGAVQSSLTARSTSLSPP